MIDKETKYKVYTKGWYPDIKTIFHTDWLTLEQCREFIQNNNDLRNIPLSTIHLISQDFQIEFFNMVQEKKK